MAKLTGNLRITANPGVEGVRPHFEVAFVPYAGRLATKSARVSNYDDLVSFLADLKFDEDDATRWAGKARSQGVVLIPSFERTESQLRDASLLA